MGSLSSGNLLYSHEDRPIQETFFPSTVQPISSLKKPSQEFHILILRDPYNMFASRWKHASKKGKEFRENPDYRDRIRSLWKEYAHSFLKESLSGKKEVVGIAFNHWVNSQKYQSEVANRLGLGGENQQTPFPIWGFGGGSSFDGLNHQSFPHKMKLQERWKIVSSLPEFHTWAEDQELENLSRKILGFSLSSNKVECEDDSIL